MSAGEAYALIDRTATLRESGLAFHVVIRDVQFAYGQVRAVIVPVAGEGTRTVNLDRLTLIET